MSTDTVNQPIDPPVEVAAPEVSRRHERWPYDDVKRLLRAATLADTRNVAFALVCKTCEERLVATSIDNAGNTLVECACTVRVWER